MDWLFITQLFLFALYFMLLYFTHKSGVGTLKKGETLDSKFWTAFFMGGMALGMGLGMLGGVAILASFTFVFSHIDEMNFWVNQKWNTLIYFIFVVSFIYLVILHFKMYKDRIFRNYKYDIKTHQQRSINRIVSNMQGISRNGIVFEEDLKNIIEAELEIIDNNDTYKSPFRDSIYDD